MNQHISTMEIYIHTPLTTAEKALLRKALAEKHTVHFGNELLPEAREDAFLGCQVAMGNVPLDWAEKTTNLQWLQLHSAGLDPYQALQNRTFPITNLKGFFGESVAETAVAGILALYRGIDRLARWQRTEFWMGQPMRASLQLLFGANVLIVGGGAIGQKTAALLRGFQCDIHTFSRTAKDDILPISDLDQYLPQADIVIACLPETPETIRLFDAQRLALLKPSAMLVNVGRGSAVDEKALMAQLKQNRLFGAVLDVTDKEPLPTDHPLWQMPNVLLTQHTSGGWAKENEAKVNFFLENLTRFEQGEELLNVADLEKGY